MGKKKKAKAAKVETARKEARAKAETPGQRRSREAGFQPGQSGNPAGRKKGSLNKTSMMARQLIAGQAKAITDKCIELAMKGDMQAINLILTRLLPPAKESPISLKLKPPKNIGDFPEYTNKIIVKVGEGKILPTEAYSVLKLVHILLDTFELIELEKRLIKLENQKENKSGFYR